MLTSRYGSDPMFWSLTRNADITTEFSGEGAVLPEQFHCGPAGIHKGKPEVALMEAVLEDAVYCYRLGSHSPKPLHRRLAREAEVWLFSGESQWPFSFLYICNVLNLDPQYIRSGLSRLSQSQEVGQGKRRRVVAPRRLLRLAA